MTKCTEALRLLEEFAQCEDVRRLDDLVREAHAFLADKGVSCDAEKAVLEGALRSLETVTRSYLRYPLEGEEPGYDAKDVLAYCDEARTILAGTSPAAAELCHLKDCGREAVIGTMKVWGPEYRVALCEHHVMEKLRAAAALLAERYLPLSCPNCSRVRLLYNPQSGAIRCEKCASDTETLTSFQEALLAQGKALNAAWPFLWHIRDCISLDDRAAPRRPCNCGFTGMIELVKEARGQGCP